MRAVTVLPGVKGSVRLDDIDEPPLSDGGILVRTRALGICGTDHEILDGLYGTAPDGVERLVLGHELLRCRGRGAARQRILRPAIPLSASCGVPIRCRVLSCAAGEWDMCRNGGYTERGIKERHGFGSERFPHRARVCCGGRSRARPSRRSDGASQYRGEGVGPCRAGRSAFARLVAGNLLVTGAGPIGLLAALMGRQRGLDVHVLDRNTEGRSPGWSVTSAAPIMRHRKRCATCASISSWNARQRLRWWSS